MKMTPPYRPGFFESLFKSCSSAEFYQNIDRIRLRRSVGFLVLLSLTLATAGSIFLYSYVSRPALQESMVTLFEKHVPAFESSFHDQVLETTPSHAAIFFQFDPNGTLSVLDRPTDTTFFTVRVDTEKLMTEVHPDSEVMPGIFVSRDGVVFFNGVQSERFEYSLLGLEGTLSFSKQDLKSALQAQLPNIVSWLQRSSITFVPAVLFLYVFITSWIVALLTSIAGLLYVLVARRDFSYGFFIKLSFYASVPALALVLVTKSLAMSVPYLGLLVYACFYGYGLSTYKS